MDFTHVLAYIGALSVRFLSNLSGNYFDACPCVDVYMSFCDTPFMICCIKFDSLFRGNLASNPNVENDHYPFQG